MELAIVILGVLLAAAIMVIIGACRECKDYSDKVERLDSHIRLLEENEQRVRDEYTERHRKAVLDAEEYHHDVVLRKDVQIVELQTAIKLFFRLSPPLAEAFRLRVCDAAANDYVSHWAVKAYLEGEAAARKSAEFLDLQAKFTSGPDEPGTVTFKPNPDLPVRKYGWRDADPSTKLYSEDVRTTTEESGE